MGHQMITQKLRIQRVLVSLVAAHEFPVVTYDSTGAPNDIVTEGPEKAVALAHQPILCNETSSAFAEDERNGRDVVQARDTWNFALRVKFDREVLLELFEEEVMDNPPKIPGDSALGLPFVILRLINTEVEHPVQQQGASGTIVEFTFQAVQGRR